MNSLDKALHAAATRLTDRDRYLCRLLADHDVLTTSQLQQAAFTGMRRTSQRLSQLAGLGVVEGIRPRAVTAAIPLHWILGPVGVHVAAAELALTVKAAAARRDAARHLVLGRQLAHRIGTNQIFTSLLAVARSPSPPGRLEDWWSARRCAAEVGRHIRPDGYGSWTSPRRTVDFFVEYDLGTERLARLAAKLDGYANLADAAGRPCWILFAFPSPSREAHARKVLTPAAAALQLPVATTHDSADPAGPIWQPAAGLQRHALDTLPDAAAAALAGQRADS